MKINSKPTLLALVLTVVIVAAVYAKTQSLYVVINNTNYNIGNVTLNLQTGNPVVVKVTGNGSFNADVSTSVSSADINSVNTVLGATQNITTSAGDQIKCSVGATSIVIN